MKKPLSFLLCLLLLACLSVTAFASGEVYSEGPLQYTIDNESITVVGCFGKNAEITVPSSIAGIPVNSIAANAFSGNRYLEKLNLPDTITTVEDGAIGDGIIVVYNSNTDHPSLEPTELILGTGPKAVPSQDLPADEPEPPAAGGAEIIAEPQVTPSGDAQSEAAGASDAEDAVVEYEVDLDEVEEKTGKAENKQEKPEAAEPKPAEPESVEPKPAAPQTAEPAQAAEPAKTAQKPAKQTEKSSSGGAWVWWLAGICAACIAAAVVIILRRRASDRSERS